MRALVDLDGPACLRLLREGYLGRLAHLRDGRPDVVPVNYCMDGDVVVVRVAAGAMLDAIADRDVAFEIDGADLVDHSGWSVVVHGRAEQVTDPDEVERLRGLPLRPWAPGTRDRYVIIRPSTMTGRRIGAVPA